MVRQPKYKAQTQSDFYANGQSARNHGLGTVPLGYAMPQGKPAKISGSITGEGAPISESSTDTIGLGPYKNIQFSKGTSYTATGRMGNQWGTGIPFEVTTAIMKRGEERFAINCAVCHGATGIGNGITSKYGLNGIANLHQQRLRDMADGEIFNTITWGKNTMMGYGSNIQVPDRWAIICYLRALQRSQNATMADVPPGTVMSNK